MLGSLFLTLSSLLFSVAKLSLQSNNEVCPGLIPAGALGFFALIPMDYALVIAAIELTGLGSLGLILDLFIAFPIELIIIILHIGFASLAYHAAILPCDEIDPKKYLLPPWGFSE